MSELFDHSVRQVIAGAVVPYIPGEPPHQSQRAIETAGLIEALGCKCAFVSEITVRNPNPALLMGRGQLDTLKARLVENECELFVVDGALTPIQQRNLERDVGCKVIDRTGLILEIFGRRARTKAGRLQVETARLAYERSRLVRTWTHLERQRGGGGFISGPGETQIESDRRMLDASLLRLKKQLRDVEKTRHLHRTGRKSRDLPVIALVGYTNAGKSTLFNALASADVFAKDMPFATLDPTVRQIELPNTRKIALIDTVGFITDLPTPLIESFKATLEETMEADLLLHVHDAASPDANAQSRDVERVLSELETLFREKTPPMVHVWNKADLLTNDERSELAYILDQDKQNPSVVVSAVKGQGLEELIELISQLIFRNEVTVDLSIAVEDAAAIPWLYQHAKVQSHKVDDKTGVTDVSVMIDRENWSRFQSVFPVFAELAEEGDY